MARLETHSVSDTLLHFAEVQDSEVDIQRAAYEHAITVLIHDPPTVFTLPPDPIPVAAPTIPVIPGILPSQFPERRPDIVSYERSMAQIVPTASIAKIPINATKAPTTG